MMKLLIAALFVAAASGGKITKENEKLQFEVTMSRSIEEAPTIEVTFANGLKDQLELTHYKMNENAAIGCNYVGHLRSSPSSVVGVTGCLNKPGDRMELTIISEHNINKMFSVDFYGNAEVIKNPFEEGALSRALLKNRVFAGEATEGDEIFDQEEENLVHAAAVTSIPSKLKAVIKFGYEDTMASALNGENFNSWIAAVFTHTQTHFRHSASLGTTIEFEVQGDAVYKQGASWTADDDIYNARDESNALNLDGVDVVSWWCDNGGGGVAGIAFVGALCTSYHTNLNEKQWSSAGSGFVLAHELGHNFGMSHDFDEKHGGESGPCNGQGIMSYGSYDYDQWSTCSKSDWEEHYSGMNWGDGCLEDISDGDTTEGPTEAPGPEVCFDVTTYTTQYGNENEWTIGCTDGSCKPCASEDDFGDNSQYSQQCCLPQSQTEFAVTCIDTWGDGWHGGYLEINGQTFCSDFTSGSEYQEVLVNDGDGGTEPVTVCTTIKIVTKRWGSENSWTFGACSSAQEYRNREVYTEECCQLEGNYQLVCKDSYGDGWHKGYMQIGDDPTKYCKDFRAGAEQSQEVEMTGVAQTEAPPTEGPTEGPTGGPTEGPTEGPTAGPTNPPSSDCGMLPGSIVGGDEASPYSLPWQVGLVHPGGDRTWCGGTLISATHVLTAAHCMGRDFEIIVGEHDVTSSSDGTRHTVCSTTSHPDYNSGTTNNDYAIVRLTEPVQLGARAVPACLPNSDFAGTFLDDKTMTVSGWGSTDYGAAQADVLMKVDVPGMTNAVCGQKYSQFEITDSMLCAGRETGGIDSCQGDSGGPLTYTTGTPARTYLVGVVSWGIGCAFANNPGVYARVTTVLPWINEQLATECPST